MPDFSTYPNNRQKLTDKTDAITDSSPALTDKIPDIFTDMLTKSEKEFLFAIYPYLCEHGEINNYRAQTLADKSADSAKKYFAKLVSIGYLKAVGNNKARVYRLADFASAKETVAGEDAHS